MRELLHRFSGTTFSSRVEWRTKPELSGRVYDYKVTVGSTLHPMVDDHYIEWIELLADGKSYSQFLNPGDEPIAIFAVEAATVSAREHCNKHGLWKA